MQPAYRRGVWGLTIVASCLVFSGCQFLSPSADPGDEEGSTTAPTNNQSSNNVAANQTTVTTPGNNQTTVANNQTSPPKNNQTTPNPGMVCDAPDPTPLRRLSHFEYWNTIYALYPGVNFPDVALPADSRPHEFDNDADVVAVAEVPHRCQAFGAVATREWYWNCSAGILSPDTAQSLWKSLRASLG